ncbi:DoxX family membrane protein [Streptomyces radicis]|uniref:DoxX family membrane protein n=1 Tax=Streptomyces radicis TaxID=1750517 RepID=A0A3A9W9E5_9ACTN|nr:DoxX family membrane protein [Streptomyces radicis]RKN09715.1 DoxX family membrane protein [Streptomyces radicis]RKN23353.1 DoxX family membrane protein [Streptomyces radicis]
MSVDTRTPRGGLTLDEPVLSTVKVPSDPAQVVVNHASFRVRLATPPPVSIAVPDTAELPRIPAAGRRRPLVWSGRSAPGDAGASTLLRAVREAGDARAESATRVLPRVTTGARPPVVGPRAPQPSESTRLLPAARGGEGAFDGVHHGVHRGADDGGRDGARDGVHDGVHDAYAEGAGGDGGAGPGPAARPEPRQHRADARQAYYPGRHLSLGVVLLPLRLLLGFMAIYAGMGKLTNPVYFDGGERGSLNAWLASLHPWGAADPLHQWALSHPVGAGLTVAFTQIIIGVLTVFGLWQRLAAGIGVLLSLALLVTVSWRSGPAYDTPDLFLAAAWSPLLIAGAPVYSLDARLASEAWRRLGPRVPLADLRHRVLRRGAALATLLIGLALLIGSLLGSAVRSDRFPTLPGPGQPPRNHLPGEPLPEDEAPERDGETSERSEERGASPEESASPDERGGQADEESPRGQDGGDTGAPGADAPGESSPSAEQTVPAPQQQPAAPDPYVPEEPAAPSSPDAGDAGESVDESPSTEEGGDGSSLSPIGGLLG